MAGFKTLMAKLMLDDSQFKRGLKGAKTSTDYFASGIKKLGGMIAGAFAISSIVNFVKSSFQAYQTLQQAEIKLLTSLKGRKDIQEDFILQAKTLSSTTMFSRIDIMNAQMFAASLQLTEEQIKKIIPVAINMSTVFGTDIQTAVFQLAKTLSGTLPRGSLAAIQGLKNLTKEELQAGKAIDIVRLAVEGQAAAINDTALGSIDKLNKSWTSLKRNFGEGISPAVKDFVDSLNSAIVGYSKMRKESVEKEQKSLFERDIKEIEELAESYQKLGIEKDKDLAKDKAAKAIREQLMKLYQTTGLDAGKGLGILYQIKNIDEYISKIGQVSEVIGEQVGLYDKLKIEIDSYNQLIDETNDEKLIAQYQREIQLIEIEIQRLKELGNERAKEATFKMQPLGAGQIPVTEAGLTGQKMIQKHAEDTAITYHNLNEQIAAYQTLLENTSDTKLIAQYQGQIELIEKQISALKELGVTQKTNQEINSDFENSFSDLAGSMFNYAASIDKSTKSTTHAWMKMISDLLPIVIRYITLMTAKSSASAIAGGAAAGEATGAAAPITTPIFIAELLAIVLGYLGSLEFAKGGIVPGNSFSGDNILAGMNSREMVLSLSQQRGLWDLINGRGGKNDYEANFKIYGGDLVASNNFEIRRRSGMR